MPRILLLLIILIPCWSWAADKPEDKWTFNLYFENDLFTETDQDYTNGIKLAWVSPDLTDYINDPSLPGWLRSINKRLTFFHPSPGGLQRNLVFSIGQTIYTPEDIDATQVVLNDRPYAGWLYTSFAYHVKNQNQLDSLDVQIGVVGPAALGEEAQDFIHDLRGFDEFKGWDNQIGNELGIAFIYEHKDKIINRTDRFGNFGYDVITHFGGSLGNVATYLNAGAEIRFGWLIPNDFGTSAVRPGGDNSAPGANWDPRINNPESWGMHAFISIDGRLVGHDIFLDGNTIRNSHSVDKKAAVVDFSVGISSVFAGYKISFAQVFRTKEFKGQDNSHSYGSLSISFSY